MDDILLVYVTCADADQARSIARAAVEAHLAACANVLPGMTSVYRWQGAVEEAAEAVLLLKTDRTHYDDLQALVRMRHSYEVPCIMAIAISRGSPEYLAWLRAGLSPG
jgi:periplasmic divalent cation tolerance protein